MNNKRHATNFGASLRRRKGDASTLENTIISLKDIAVSFDGEQVLKGFNLDIRDGQAEATAMVWLPAERKEDAHA